MIRLVPDTFSEPTLKVPPVSDSEAVATDEEPLIAPATCESRKTSAQHQRENTQERAGNPANAHPLIHEGGDGGSARLRASLETENSEMLKLSNTTKNAALAAVLGVGLVGSAAVTLAPVAAQAQWHRDTDNRGFHRDWDDRGFHRDWDDRGFRRDWDDRFHVGVGFGVYGYPYYPYYSGYYDPYYYYDPFWYRPSFSLGFSFGGYGYRGGHFGGGYRGGHHGHR